MSHSFSSSLLAAGIALAAATSQGVAQDPGAGSLAPNDPIPADPDVIRGTLENGLSYIIRENGRPENRALLRLVVNAGSILEDEDQLGLAHFVEHMAFNGTANFEKQEIVDYLESIGMQFGPHINAYTGFDETVYMLQVPMDDPEVLDKGFQILSDWARGVTFDSEEVDKERGVVIEEWRGGRGADARMQDKQFPVMFEGSRYADRLPIGKPEVLESAPPEVLRRFYDEWYRPNLMGVVAVGDFDASDIEAKIRTYFGAISSPAEVRERFTAEVPIDHPARVAIATDEEAETSQVGVIYKQATRPSGSAGDFRRGLVEDLYAGMLNARLEELRMQADAPFLFAFSGSGGFVREVDVYQLLALVPEGGIQRGLDALLSEGERVVRHGFTETELDRQKAELRRRYEMQVAEKENQESAQLAGLYVQVLLEGDPYPSVETEMALVNSFLPDIALAETNALANAWLQEQGRVVLVNAPEKEGLETPGDEEISSLFATVRQKDLEPYEDVTVDAPLLAEMPGGSPVVSEERADEIWTLENGIRVVLKPTDFKDDEVRFRATQPGGHLFGR